MNATFEIPCPRCSGTAKSAGMDCPDCRIDGFPTGRIEVQRVHARPRMWWDKRPAGHEED